MFGFITKFGFKLVSGIKAFINYAFGSYEAVNPIDNKVYGKNIGTSNLKPLYKSGNPFDFQGSQSIVVDSINSSTFDIRNDFTILLGCKPSSANNALFGNSRTDLSFLLYTRFNDTTGTRFFYNGTPYKFKTIETEEEHLSYKCLGITKSGTTLKFYWYGEVTATYTNVALPTSNNFISLILGAIQVGVNPYDGTYDNFYLSDNVLSDEDIKKHTEYPNDFYQDMVNDDRILFCTDFRGNSDVGYIADGKNYSEGIVNAEVTSTRAQTNGTGNTITEGTTGTFYFHNESPTTASYLPLVSLINSNQASDELYLMEVSITITSGSAYARQIETRQDQILINSVLSTGDTHTETFISNYQSDGTFRFFFDAFNDYSGTVHDTFDATVVMTAKKLQGTHQVTGYSPTCVTNYPKEDTGLQDLTRKFNPLGFFEENVDYLNCPSDNDVKGQYVDTLYTPPDDVAYETIEIAFTKLNTPAEYYTKILSGVSDSGVFVIEFTKDYTDRGYIRYRASSGEGSAFIGTNFIDDRIYICIVNDNYNYTLYINNVPIISRTVGAVTSTIPYRLLTSYLEHENVEGIKVEVFNIHKDKALIEAERTANYTKYRQGLL